MAIIQISKLQQRSGNLVDLPQLSEAEFGWASDEKRLFIGKETPNENIEVLTSYSRIDFSQLEGSVGNLNISSANVANGQVLAYDGNNWVNKGGSAGGFISLGTVSNVQITGGAINYVLTTDGLGNLSWTPKGALYSNIANLTPDAANSFGYGANAVIMEVDENTPYTNGTAITISGVEGNANSNVNGQVFYVKLSNDYPTSGNTILFLTDDLANANVYVDSALEYDNPPDAIATSTIGSGSGAGLPGGTTNSVQYYDGSGFAGDANFTWNGSNLSVTGNTNISNNLSVGGIVTTTQLVSNIANGTAPLTVTSTTKVANLNVDMIDGYDTSVASAVTTVVVRDASANILANNVNTNKIFNGTSNITVTAGGNIDIYSAGNANTRFRATSSNVAVGGITFTINANTVSNGNIDVTGNITSGNVYANSGTIGASLLTGTLTTAAQPNITSVGTLTSLAVTGNITSGNVYANSGTIGASLLTGTLTTAAQPNITSVGTLTSLAVTGNITASNVYANSGTIGASLLTGTLTTAAQPNITSVGTLTSVAVTGNITSGNVYANSGTIGASLLTGTLTTAAQPNITSVGTLTSLAVTGNITGANVTTSSHVIRSVATGISAAGTVQGDATLLAKDINIVSTVSAGQGVRLPVAVAGMVIIVNNTSATDMNVYPSSGAKINSLATNASYTHVAAASLQYYAISSTQWYTVGATYS